MYVPFPCSGTAAARQRADYRCRSTSRQQEPLRPSARPITMIGMRRTGVLLGILLMAVAGCTGSSPSSRPGPTHAPAAIEGHISGVLLISAMYTRTTAGTVTLDGPVSRLIRVGSDGRFAASVPAGQYRLTGHSPLYGSGAYPCKTVGDAPVTIAPAVTVAAQVVCVER
jgi:hypothetical protein